MRGRQGPLFKLERKALSAGSCRVRHDEVTTRRAICALKAYALEMESYCNIMRGLLSTGTRDKAAKERTTRDKKYDGRLRRWR